jgi:tetratricopeptide (TPR) repeat protein
MDAQLEHLIQRGRDAFERRDYAAALADFRGVLQERPGFADLRNLAGVCLSMLGRVEEALAEFDRALVINPDYAEVHLNRSLVLHEAGRYAEAQEAMERAGRIEEAARGDGFTAGMASRLANAHADLGDLYLSASAPAEAASQYRAALELRPLFVDIRRKLAVALIELGDVVAAEAELMECLEVNPRFLDARVSLGSLYDRSGRGAEAEAAWREVLALDPAHARARAQLSMLERRRVLHGTGEA